MTVTLEVTGLSLLTGRLAVFNSVGALVGSARAAGAGQDLTLVLPNLKAGFEYYVRVDELQNTAFATGQYRLLVTGPEAGPPTVTLGGQPPTDDANANDSFLSATRLDNVAATGTAYRTFAHLRANDADVYTVHSPFPGLNQANVLTATVQAFGDLAPEVTVSNAIGLAVAARLIADGNGLYTVQVDNAAPNADYLLTVRSRTGAIGDYELRANLRSVVTSPHEVDSGLLTVLKPSTTGTIQVTGSAQLYFRLSALLTPGVGPSVAVRVYDANNVLRFQLLARAGDTVDGVALLGPGTYRVVISGNGEFLPSVATGFSLAMALLTDPVGVKSSDPNDPAAEEPPPPPPSGYNYYNDRGYYTWGETTPTTGGGG
jgi:hypothetical protein